MEDNFSSEAFILKLKEKDNEAITVLVQKYNIVLFRAALAQVKDAVLAEELAQDTWDSFFAAIDRFEGRSHIRTFLFGILYNKVREKRRDQAKYLDLENPDALIDQQFVEDGHWKDHPMNPEKFMRASEDLEAVEACMGELAEKQKQAFYLKEVVGEESSEICKILDVTNTNLGVLIYRAKNQLRKCLEGKAVGLGA